MTRPPAHSSGEVLCPRKGSPIPSLISVSNCKLYHDQAMSLCSALRCGNWLAAEQELLVIRKHADRPVSLDRDRPKKRQRLAKTNRARVANECNDAP